MRQGETERHSNYPLVRDFIELFDAKRGEKKQYSGGDGGIRTLDRALQPYNGLANRRLQPLGHISQSRYARHGGEPQAADFRPPNSRRFLALPEALVPRQSLHPEDQESGHGCVVRLGKRRPGLATLLAIW